MRLPQYLAGIDLTQRILEIGPLCNPMLHKHEANVYYADIASTEEVKETYQRDSTVAQEDICTIDFVVRGSYEEAFRDTQKFGYVVSSHVLEHVPRFIEFFQDIATVLDDQGRLYFFLPDSRYCFDRFRSPTSFAELYYIHTQNISVAPWQILDSINSTIPLNDPYILSTNRKVYPLLAKRSPFSHAKKRFEDALQGKFVGVHYSVFTPESFLLIMHDMVRAGLLPFTFVDFFPTPPHDFTFGGVLELCMEMTTNEKLAEQEMKKIRSFMLQLADIEEARGQLGNGA